MNDNLCRVFELPNSFPTDFCFGGGIPVTFIMVDWFNGLQIDDFETFDEWKDDLIQFVINKNYIKPDRDYIIMYSNVILMVGR